MVKTLKLFHIFIVGKEGKEKVFGDILETKKASMTIKARSQKNRKFRIFPKGLVHGFGQKSAIFPSFYFRQNRPGKLVSRYSKTEKTLF